MRSETKYYCETCGEAYPTAEQAKDCEEKHKLCYCKRYPKVWLNHSVIGYGKSIEGVLDFANKKIEVYIETEYSKTHYSSTSIRFCPHCGREL